MRRIKAITCVPLVLGLCSACSADWLLRIPTKISQPFRLKTATSSDANKAINSDMITPVLNDSFWQC